MSQCTRPPEEWDGPFRLRGVKVIRDALVVVSKLWCNLTRWAGSVKVQPFLCIEPTIDGNGARELFFACEF